MAESNGIEQFRAYINDMQKRLNAALPDIGTKAIGAFGDLLATSVIQQSAILPPDHRPGIAGALQVSSGALVRSLSLNAGADNGAAAGNTAMQFTMNASGGKLSITLGSNLPYAAIQQYGGAITPTEKMRRFMLAMVIQTQGKDDFWVKMLGHVTHGAPIIIKPTNYLDAPMQKFSETVPEIVQALLFHAIKN